MRQARSLPRTRVYQRRVSCHLSAFQHSISTSTRLPHLHGEVFWYNVRPFSHGRGNVSGLLRACGNQSTTACPARITVIRQYSTPGRARLRQRAVPDDLSCDRSSESDAQSKKVKNLFSRGQYNTGLDLSLPPLSNVHDIFRDLTRRGLKHGFTKTIETLSDRTIRVATMCSGTESPLLALELVNSSLKSLDYAGLHFDHVFSAEIVPFKQRYIERNFNLPLLFRDIREMAEAVQSQQQPKAMTAHNRFAPIPNDIDILVAGTSCVDFSKKNQRRKALTDGGESGDTFEAVLEFCKAVKPSIVILENVTAAPFDEMMLMYQEIGYETTTARLDTRDFYLPQTRQRGYMVCFNRDRLGVTNTANACGEWMYLLETLQRRASSPVSSFVRQRSRKSGCHDRALSQHPDWSNSEITAMKLRQKAGLGNLRSLNHWTIDSTAPNGSDNQKFLRDCLPRELETLNLFLLHEAKSYRYDSRFKERFWVYSENAERNLGTRGFGTTGCLTPRARVFASNDGRPLDAKDFLSLQGIPLGRIWLTTETDSEIRDLAGNAMSTTVVGAALISALIAGIKILANAAPTQVTAAISKRSTMSQPTDNLTAITTLPPRSAHVDMPELISKARVALQTCDTDNCNGPVPKLQSDTDKAQSSTQSFEKYARSSLPLVLTFTSVDLPLEIPPEYRSATFDAINSNFWFKSICKTREWIVTYTAGLYGRLELVIGEQQSEWRLYAHAKRDPSADDNLRTMLQQPVLKASADLEFPAKNWCVRVPSKTSIDVSVRGVGPAIPTWFSRIGLPDYKDHTMWEQLEIEVGNGAPSVARQLNGVYKHVSGCGTAAEGLYQQLPADKDRPVFFFLEPDPVGEARKDCYVFSPSRDRFSLDDNRTIPARVEPSWRPWSVEEPYKGAPRQSQTALFADEWRNCNAILSPADISLEVRTPEDVERLVASTDHTRSMTVLGCSVAANALSCDSVTEDRPVEAPIWLSEVFHNYNPAKDWLQLPKKLSSTDRENCNARLPPLDWKLVDGKLEAYENSTQVAIYERTINSQPCPARVQLITRDGSARFALEVNATVLAQRAVSRLPVATQNISLEWRLVTDTQPADFVFQPFHLLPVNENGPASERPDMPFSLTSFQSKVVSWMKDQERGVLFELAEIEEGVCSNNSRAEARARASVEVRGGICADEAGFGKTMTCLSLIHSDFQEHTPFEIVSDLEKRQATREESSGLEHTAATLIICPTSLQRQWLAEINDKLGSLKDVISIHDVDGLNEHTPEDFRHAMIIVVNQSVLTSDAYVDRLAAFAALPGPVAPMPGKSPVRNLVKWRRFAVKQVPDQLQMLRSHDSDAFKAHVQERYRVFVGSAERRFEAPYRRLNGQKYILHKTLPRKDDSDASVQRDIDTSNITRPILEMFHFNRLILDEFQLLDLESQAAVCALKADKRWLLSATPPIADFYEVAQMAKLLGIPLPVGPEDDRTMRPSSLLSLRRTMSDFERYHILPRRASVENLSRIHEQHHRFLDAFARRNPTPSSEIKVREHLVPVKLDPDHMAAYAQLSQQIHALDMRVMDGMRIEATGSVIKDSTIAEDALAKFAAFYDRDKHPNLKSLEERAKQKIDGIAEKLIAYFTVARDEKRAQNEDQDHVDVLLTHIENGHLGDSKITRKVLELVRNAPTSSFAVKVAREVLADDQGSKAFKVVSSKAAILNTLSKRLASAERSRRFLYNIRALQHIAGKRSKCDDSDCEGTDLAADFGVDAFCGHRVCRTCHARRQNAEVSGPHCPSEDCSSSSQDSHLLWINQIGPKNSRSPHGAKWQAAISLLHKIQKKNEQAVLFVQFPSQLLEARAALKDSGIRHTISDKPSIAAARVINFRASAKKTNPTTVFVLKIDSEPAAGVSLETAAHVIFLSPLLRRTRREYEASMESAIGRVKRYGQKAKEIKVYHICALHTVDVNVLEQRMRRSRALMELGANVVLKPEDVEVQARAEHMRLVRGSDGKFSLRPRSWLIDEDGSGEGRHVGLEWGRFGGLKTRWSSWYREDPHWPE